ncbi:DUF2180 family protein [Streptomyces sp. NPDC021093]|uniref:DUF2180 family protein n=1 Tax=Streptomyces sp. NPDC021093 TaxID=3365112 RepID=UPI0037BB105C
MNCYDCHASAAPAAPAAPAVGVCHCCGAGLCPQHLRLTRPVLHRPNGLGLSHGPTPARRLACETCHAAAVGLPAA